MGEHLKYLVYARGWPNPGPHRDKTAPQGNEENLTSAEKKQGARSHWGAGLPRRYEHHDPPPVPYLRRHLSGMSPAQGLRRDDTGIPGAAGGPAPIGASVYDLKPTLHFAPHSRKTSNRFGIWHLTRPKRPE
ncbi:MAG: hypothetical protein ACREX9_21390 [Gammaproteobacteria bacterium]